MKEKLEDTKGVARRRMLKKNKQYNDQKTNNDLQNNAQKTKKKQHGHHQKLWMNSGAPELLSVPAPHVTPVLLLINDTNIIIVIKHT